MANRGRNRGRGGGAGFERGNPFTSGDQTNVLPPDKSSQHSRPYPQLDQFPATLHVGLEYDELYEIQSQIASYFQSSPYHIKVDDENAKLFSLFGQTANTKKTSLNVDWAYLPLELRPVTKRKLKDSKDIFEKLKQSKEKPVDLSLLDKLEEKEKNDDVVIADVEMKQEYTNGEAVDKENDEVEELDDEELDEGTDYISTYFDNGEEYLDEDDDVDEGPCY